MAKKSKAQSPEEIAFKNLLKKAENMMKDNESREHSKKVLQVGKEFAMLITFLRQLKIGRASEDELPKMWLAQILKDYPKELKKALDYYDALQSFDIVHNFEGFQASGDCLQKGRLWVAFNWFHLELPEKEEVSGADAGEVGK